MVRVGRLPGIYFFWKEARVHVDGFPDRFLLPTCRLEVECIFTDGSAAPKHSYAVGCGLHIQSPVVAFSQEAWESLFIDPAHQHFHGATRYNNNTGELTAL